MGNRIGFWPQGFLGQGLGGPGGDLSVAADSQIPHSVGFHRWCPQAVLSVLSLVSGKSKCVCMCARLCITNCILFKLVQHFMLQLVCMKVLYK